MKSNQIMFYNTTVNEAVEILEMESRRDDFGYIGMNRYSVKFNKKGDHVLITLLHSLDRGITVEDGIIDLKVDFPGKFRDLESIDRVQAVYALNQKSSWWKGILEDLQAGEPLSWKVEEILIEVEDRIENPDSQIWELVNKAVAEQPTNRFYRSLYDQVAGGRELSEKQIEALKKGLRHTMSFGQQPSNQIVRIEKALELDPRNRFVLSLKENAENGNQLSTRQMNVVEEIIASQSSPASKLLADLKSNAYLDRDDFMLINKGQRRGIESLNDEDRKRLRHLIYRNQRKLDNTYSKDEVRRLLKKGSQMRRSASEIIKNLESRIARLERNLGRTASMDRSAAGKAILSGVTSSSAYHEGDNLNSAESAMIYYIGATENKSKFYEMVLIGDTVEILYGRLGSAGRRADKTFQGDFHKAQKFFVKQLASKLAKGYVSAYTRQGEHSKRGPLYGSYPIGLTSTPGPWKNQDIAYQQDVLNQTVFAVSAAIKSFKLDGLVDRKAVSQLEATQLMLSRNEGKLSEHASDEIRKALDRINGTGRAGRFPVEVRTSNAIKALMKLMRKLNASMSGGTRRMASRRTRR